MKKKGLIIATIVMVLVLAVSLTTATYAWFTTTSSSSVSNINVSVAAGSDVNIGLTTTGAYVEDATTQSFVSGDCAWTTSWAGDPGLASNVNTNLTLANIQLAVGTCNHNATSYIAGTSIVDGATAQLTNENFIKANESTAKNHATGAIGTVYDASENTDFLHFTLGLQPSLTTIDTISLNMTLAATDTKQIMGMTAALHVIFKVDGEDNWHNIDLGGAGTFNTPKTTARTLSDSFTGTPSGYSVTATAYNAKTDLGTITGTTDTTDILAGSSNIKITIGTQNTAMYDSSTSTYPIHQVEIYIYYVGSDSDAVNSAVIGSSVTTYFTITNSEVSGS